jgi:hypothetical protein
MNAIVLFPDHLHTIWSFFQPADDFGEPDR